MHIHSYIMHKLFHCLEYEIDKTHIAEVMHKYKKGKIIH